MRKARIIEGGVTNCKAKWSGVLIRKQHKRDEGELKAKSSQGEITAESIAGDFRNKIEENV